MAAAKALAGAKIVVALSGGVDSSVAALLLQRQGEDLEALFMRNWEGDDFAGHCAAAEDVEDALQICERLNVPLNTVNFAADYWERVFERFLAEYRAGRTPNPDVLCNREIKFRAFLDHALECGARAIATGHYARINAGPAGLHLLKGRDAGKDQSYFLYTLGQYELAHTRFPLGELHKGEVRRLAREAGFVTHDKRDSTGICFIGERPFREFLGRYLPAAPGAVVTETGERIGTHQGSCYYTLGQRRGLGVGGVAGAREAPWYVIAKDPEHNVLTVSQDPAHPRLLSRRVVAEEISWVSGRPPPTPLQCAAKTRYRQPDQACTLTAADEWRCEVRFAAPQRAVTPGQSLVVYDGEVCLGGGVITAAD